MFCAPLPVGFISLSQYISLGPQKIFWILSISIFMFSLISKTSFDSGGLLGLSISPPYDLTSLVLLSFFPLRFFSFLRWVLFVGVFFPLSFRFFGFLLPVLLTNPSHGFLFSMRGLLRLFSHFILPHSLSSLPLFPVVF